MNTLQEIMSKAYAKRILVVGDSMLDVYIYDLSHKKVMAPGAAANAAANVWSLGSLLRFSSILGSSDMSSSLLRVEAPYLDNELLVTAPVGGIPLKRYFVDRKGTATRGPGLEESPFIDQGTEFHLLFSAARELPYCDAILISDYGRGSVTDGMLGLLYEHLRNNKDVPCVVDAKDLRRYTTFPATVLCPNEEEARKFVASFGEVEEIRTFLEKTIAKHTVMTAGKHGCYIYGDREDVLHHVPASRVVVRNSVGAGDTFSAALTISLACGADIFQAAHIANIAAGLACESLTTSAVTSDSLHLRLHEPWAQCA